MLWKRRDKNLKLRMELVIDNFNEYIKLLKEYEELGQAALFSVIPDKLVKLESEFMVNRLKLEEYLLNKHITTPVLHQVFDKEYMVYPSARDVLSKQNSDIEKRRFDEFS